MQMVLDGARWPYITLLKLGARQFCSDLVLDGFSQIWC